MSLRRTGFGKFAAALILGHLALGGIASLLSDGDRNFVTSIFIGLVFAQTSLLGVWAGLGPQAVLVRVILVPLGVLLIQGEIHWGIAGEAGWKTVILLVIATGFVASVAAVVRMFCDLRRVHKNEAFEEGLRFTITHLVAMTSAIAVVLAVGRAMASVVRDSDDYAEILALGICFAMLGLIAMWAWLGNGRCLLRTIVLVLFAGIIGGVVIPYFLDHGPVSWLWISAALSSALIQVVTLALVRAQRYRLVRKSRKVLQPEASVSFDAVN